MEANIERVLDSNINEDADWATMITGDKAKSIMKLRLENYKVKYEKRANKCLFEKPEYLMPFREPPTMGNIKSTVKSILNGTFDEKGEDTRINTIMYQHLPNNEKLNFRTTFLRHVPISVLEEKKEKARKKQIEEKLIAKQRESIVSAQKKFKGKPTWVKKFLHHEEEMEMLNK